MYAYSSDESFNTDDDYDFALWDPLGWVESESTFGSYYTEEDEDGTQDGGGGIQFPFAPAAICTTDVEPSLASQELQTEETSRYMESSVAAKGREYPWTLDASIVFPPKATVKSEDDERDDEWRHKDSLPFDDSRDEEDFAEEIKRWEWNGPNPLESYEGVDEQPKQPIRRRRLWRKVRPVVTYKSRRQSRMPSVQEEVVSGIEPPTEAKAGAATKLFSCMHEVKDEELEAELAGIHQARLLMADDESKSRTKIFSCHKKAVDEASEFSDNYSAVYDMPLRSGERVDKQSARREKSQTRIPAVASNVPLLDRNSPHAQSHDNRSASSQSIRKSLLCKKIVEDARDDYQNSEEWFWSMHPQFRGDNNRERDIRDSAGPDEPKASALIDSDNFWESMPWSSRNQASTARSVTPQYPAHRDSDNGASKSHYDALSSWLWSKEDSNTKVSAKPRESIQEKSSLGKQKLLQLQKEALNPIPIPEDLGKHRKIAFARTYGKRNTVTL